jgi:hypothetical protein
MAKKDVEPSPGLDWTQILPQWQSAIRLQIARPLT